MGAARDKLTLSEQNALEAFRMAEGYIACRRALEQITRNGSRNVGMALQACRFRHAASGIERIARRQACAKSAKAVRRDRHGEGEAASAEVRVMNYGAGPRSGPMRGVASAEPG